jgi:hypothetical protein
MIIDKSNNRKWSYLSLFLLAGAFSVTLYSCALEEIPPTEEDDPDPIPNENWQCGDPWEDTRDGQFYNTVQINNTCFFAENINFNVDDSDDADTGDDGDYVGTGLEQCLLNQRYYTFVGALEAIPDGWHIVDKDDLLLAFANLNFPSPTVDELLADADFNALGGGVYDNPNCGDQGLPMWWITENGEPKFWLLEGSDMVPTTPFGGMLNVRCAKD